MTFSFQVRAQPTPQTLKLEPGESLFITGANGGGKTRLAVEIEQTLGERCHRISAHRALLLNPEVPKVSEEAALRGLRFGHTGSNASTSDRQGIRWKSQAATSLLNDFDFLLQALYAEQTNTALETHKRNRLNDHSPAPETKFETLTRIWSRVLPHRTLHISGDQIEAEAGAHPGRYTAAEMSDGERAVFYLLGQVLVAGSNTLLVFDEPELHIHRAILSRLWDEIDAARPDCAKVIISHDLDFVASRDG